MSAHSRNNLSSMMDASSTFILLLAAERMFIQRSRFMFQVEFLCLQSQLLVDQVIDRFQAMML